MTHRFAAFIPVAVVSALSTAAAGPLAAQAPEVKVKPPLYTYVGNFAFPRNKWAEVQKQAGGADKIFEKAMSSGALVAYGHDTDLVHAVDGFTHDSFWSGMTMAGVLGVLDELDTGGTTTGSVFSSATRHSDSLFVSRYYNWKPGSHFKGAYTHVAAYNLKQTAPDDALDVISKSFGVPLFEKLLADGTIVEYEIDQEQIHTESVNRFWVIYICSTADGLDKVNAALGSAFGASGLVGPALNGLTESEHHNDYLGHTDGVYK